MTDSDNTPPGLRRQTNANTSAAFLRLPFGFAHWHDPTARTPAAASRQPPLRPIRSNASG